VAPLNTLYFDGLFRSIPGSLTSKNHAGISTHAGIMCYGWLVFRGKQVIARGHGAFARGKDATSNIAEYLALIEGLDALLDMGLTKAPLKVCGDAKGVIDQMLGAAEVNARSVRPLYHRACGLAQRFADIDWEWTPRRRNQEADSLTRRALRQLRLDSGSYQAAVQAAMPGQSEPRKIFPLIDLRIYGRAALKL
jgi:ribonuclease HI